MKTYDLRKGTFVRLQDGRKAELLDSARRLTRFVRTGVPFSGLEPVCSYDINAYIGEDGAWHEDLEYSEEEIRQRKRRELLDSP